VWPTLACFNPPPLIFFCLASSFMKFQGVQQIPVHTSPWYLFQTKEYYPSYNQDTKDTPRDVKMSHPLTSPSCTLCCLSWDPSIFRGVLEFHKWPHLIRTQYGNTYNQKKTISIIIEPPRSVKNRTAIESAINQRKFNPKLPIKNTFDSLHPINLLFPQFTSPNGILCCNPNIGFTTKCGMQGPMRPRECV
jgi:hypothetical protein